MDIKNYETYDIIIILGSLQRISLDEILLSQLSIMENC